MPADYVPLSDPLSTQAREEDSVTDLPAEIDHASFYPSPFHLEPVSGREED